MIISKNYNKRRFGRWVGFSIMAIILTGSGIATLITLPHSHILDWRAQQNWSGKIPARTTAVSAVTRLGPAVTDGTSVLPIVMYHKTPVDFEQQLLILERRGFTTVTLQEVTAAFGHPSQLPPKPVVLTFDDGFADDMKAFTLLEKHHMKATFYIVNGGPSSHWCIGASRRYNDPSQQTGGCGDTYLNWDQIRELDRSGLITIGGHTIDHVDLATQTIAAQRHEIIDSKTGIEQELNHPIYDFAFPYGSFDASSIAIVRQAGYTSAVTTLPGVHQDQTQPFTLRRIRDVQSLP